MNINYKFPTKEEAENILLWAFDLNPGPWADHCRSVAKAAEIIALNCGLNPEKAYVFGLFHDIGYYGYKNGKGTTCHIYFGYQLMIDKGYEEIAKICLSHSFPIQDFST
jgi:HD superfamily phosphodiesterase